MAFEGGSQAAWPILSDRAEVSRSVCAAMVFLYLVGWVSDDAEQWLALSLSSTIVEHYHVWTLATSGFFHTSFLVLAANVAVVVLAGPRLERMMGGRAFFSFVAWTTVAIGVGSFFYLLVHFYSTMTERYLVESACGFSGVAAAFTVAYAQREPNAPLVASRPHVLRRHAPLALAAAAAFMHVLGAPEMESTTIVMGIYFGWLYLRFFAENDETKAVGDPREEFALHAFFPGPLRVVVMVIGAISYKIASQCGLFRAAAKEASLSLPTSAAAARGHAEQYSVPFTPVADPAAERRRALAIKAIDAKLAKLSRGLPGSGAAGTGADGAAGAAASAPTTGAAGASKASAPVGTGAASVQTQLPPPQQDGEHTRPEPVLPPVTSAGPVPPGGISATNS